MINSSERIFMTFKTWADLKKYRLEKNISDEQISAYLRLPLGRVEYLETGNFENDDLIILKLQLKNYAKFLDIPYQDIIALAELEKPAETQLPDSNYTAQPQVKKTHSYRGRKKQFNPVFIYSLVVLAAIVIIIVLNRYTNTVQPEYSLYESNSFSSDTTAATETESEDTASAFKPYIPQSQTDEIVSIDPLEGLAIYKTYNLRTPVNLNVYPRNSMVYHYDMLSGAAKENLIIKDQPAQFTLRRLEQIILYQAQNCRLLIDNIDLFTESYTKVAVTLSENDIVTVYVK